MAGELSVNDRATEQNRKRHAGGKRERGSRGKVVEDGSQLELIGTESDDRLDKKICFWDWAELAKSFYEPKQIDAVNGLYIMDAAEKQRFAEKQIARYAARERTTTAKLSGDHGKADNRFLPGGSPGKNN